jgi:hypothetical protein
MVRFPRLQHCLLAVAMVFVCASAPTLSLAQAITEAPPNPVARPLTITPGTPLSLGEAAAPDPFETSPAEETALPSVDFQVVVPDRDAPGVPVQLSAVLNEAAPALQRDLVWTIYALGDDQVDDEDLMLNATGGVLDTELPPGSYIVHVSFGLATLSRPLTVTQQGLTEVFNLNAGGISVRGAIGADSFLPDEAVTFEVFPETVENFETTTPLARDVEERSVLVVPAGRYTVVSRYGDVNAIVRAQIDVEPGQLTEAVMFHNAAQITLKLVNEPNGEALPNTAWSVLNPGGDIVREFVGAFPTMVLTEGDYTIIARHDGQVFSRDFAVVTGINREEELVAQ